MFFINLFKKNKSTVAITIFLLIFIIIGISTPFQYAKASFLDDIFALAANSAKNFFMSIFGNIAYYLVYGTTALAQVCNQGFIWVLTGGPVGNISYTGVMGNNKNEVVATGWPEVRDLANMVIVLGFVIIGIATTLRINDYEAKRLLPKLIIVALMVNFSLVFCGIIIDGSNILTKHYGDLASGNVTGSKYFCTVLGCKGESTIAGSDTGAGTANNIYLNIKSGGTKEIVLAIEKTILLVFSNIIMAIVYFLLMALFLFRYVALWILVILSPLAFACYALPFTKKVWDMWWNNFLNWCIVGIPAAFFVYLANKVAVDLITKASDSTAAALRANESSLLTSTPIMAYLVPVALMVLGLILSLKISAEGSKATIGAAKWAGGAAIGTIAGAAAGGAARLKSWRTGGNASGGTGGGGGGPSGGGRGTATMANRPTGWGGGGTGGAAAPGTGPRPSGGGGPTPATPSPASNGPKQSLAFRAGQATRNAYEKVKGVMPSTDTAYRAGRATRNAYEVAKAAPGKAYDKTIGVAKSGYDAAAEGVKSRYEGIKEAGGIAGGWAKSGYEATKEGVKSRYEGVKEAGGMVGSGARSAVKWAAGKMGSGETPEQDLKSNIDSDNKPGGSKPENKA